VSPDGGQGSHPGEEGIPAGQSVSCVLIVGAGLIGTSLGLALRSQGVDVYLADRDAAAAALAQDLGAGRAREPAREPDVVVLATPPASIATVLIAYQRLFLTATFSDLASVKSQPQREIEAAGGDTSRFVGGHPLAGRERSGAGAARADLFEGRPWVLTPSPATSSEALDRASRVATLCGAQVVTMTPQRHDEAVALVSHVPQLMASLTAARLASADRDLVDLSGQGVRDVTRVAASDPALWTEILVSNAPFVLDVLDAVSADLDALCGALAAVTAETASRGTQQAISRHTDRSTDRLVEPVTRLLERGNLGQGRIPGKHGAPPATYTMVPVVVPDSPGELARLLVACGDAGINVEDVSIEHSPGQPVGLVEIAVRPPAAQVLAQALRERGWSVHF
jgi:prephenate dehydrogenase